MNLILIIFFLISSFSTFSLQLKCYDCGKNCENPSNLIEYTCNEESNVCLSYFYKNKPEIFTCSNSTVGSKIINEDHKLYFCDTDLCNKKVDLLKLPQPVDNITQDTGILCHYCEDCDKNQYKKFCSNGNACFSGLKNNKIWKECIKSNPVKNICGNLIIDEKQYFGCVCDENLCNSMQGSQTLQCYQCENCIKPYDSYLKTCPPGAFGCFKKLGKKVEELGCSIRSSGLLWEDSTYLYQYCSGSGCNLRGLVEE